MEANNDNVSPLNPLNLNLGSWNEIKLNGVTSYRATVLGLRSGQELLMVREPDNPYDPNAICVKTLDGAICGYVPRDLATSLAPIFDQYSKTVAAQVVNLLTANVKNSNTGVLIRFQVPKGNLQSEVEKVDFSRLSSKVLTNEQKAIVLHPTGQHARILAVAGSGKTETLVMLIKHLVENKGVNPESIRILMFNRNIRTEFQGRLNRPADGVSGIANQVNTFHSLATIIRKYAQQIGLDSTPWKSWEADNDLSENASPEKALHALRLVIDGLEESGEILKGSVGMAEAETAISAWKNALIPPEDAGHLENPDLVKVYKAFEDYRKKQAGITFDDFVPLTVRLLERSPRLRERFCSGLRYIFVDEYQDVNYAQQRLIELLAGDHADVIVIGDDDQTLYEWRGARPDYILKKFERRFSNRPVKTYRLTHSFRFGPLIAQCAENSIQWNSKRHEKSVVAYSFDQPAEVHVMEQGETEHKNSNRWIKEQILNLLKTKRATPQDVIVLCRMYAQLSMLEAEFVGQIPYRIVGQAPFFKRHEAAALLDYLYVGIHFQEPLCELVRQAFLKIANTPNRILAKSILEKQTLLARDKGLSLSDALTSALEDRFFPFNEKQRDNLIELIVCLEGVHRRSKDQDALAVGEILNWLKDTLKFVFYLENYFGKGEPSYERIEAMDNFIDYALERPMPAAAFLEHIAELDTTLGVPKEKQIVMTTVYRVKGEQFPYVVIPNCNEGYMPSRYEMKNSIFDRSGKVQEAELSASIENERRLFYVALTRATKGIYIGAGSPEGAGGYPSRFLDEIDLSETQRGLDVLQSLLTGGHDIWEDILGKLKSFIGKHAILRNFDKYIVNNMGKAYAGRLSSLDAGSVRRTPQYRFENKWNHPPLKTNTLSIENAEPNWWDD